MSTSSDMSLLERFRINVDWFNNNLDQLTQYQGMFLAICNQNIIDADIDINELLTRLSSHPDRKAIYVTQLIHRNNPCMI
jgi:hypothetical protein